MIITFIFNFIAVLVNLLSSLLNFLLAWTFPVGLQAAITWMFTPLSYFSSFIDIAYLSQIVGYAMGFFIMFMTYLVLKFGWGMITGHDHTFSGFDDSGVPMTRDQD